MRRSPHNCSLSGMCRLFLLMLPSLLVFEGCSLLDKTIARISKAGQEEQGIHARYYGQSAERSNPVVDVKVLEEVFDGDLLAVVLGIESGEKLSSDDLQVEIVFFGEGKQLTASRYPLSHLRRLEDFGVVGDRTLPSGSEERVILQHTVPAGTTDYQLKVSWGEGSSDTDGAEILLAAEPHELAMECADSCDVPFEIALSLKNPTSKTLESFHFISWFSASSEGGKTQDGQGARATGQEDKERVGRFSLTGQRILPGESLEVSVRLKRPLPYSLYEAGFRPQVELVSFEFASEDR